MSFWTKDAHWSVRRSQTPFGSLLRFADSSVGKYAGAYRDDDTLLLSERSYGDRPRKRNLGISGGGCIRRFS
ncbi:hypothetical protein GYMLUDRAFT_596554 [Collybiopsis luxurians FD-317 M1]|uniref:Uncharacterized protein n=1 Tax=Collybiopsis luxurians FD-317 M1 TaxID=944289 RepID=A0A0D0CX92_9AGAR|nr:hypothetical protein GYMLUDRAFT_596554 [Collybiopsis luxurians FD-317 M1]